MRRTTLLAVMAATFALVLATDPAFAQIGTGGGGGQLSQLIQWVITNIVRVAISAGVIGVAIALLFAFANPFVVA